MDWFLAYAFMKTRSNTHKKIKTNISYDFTKGADNYLETRQQTILLHDEYTKKRMAIVQPKGTALPKMVVRQRSQTRRRIERLMMIRSPPSMTANTSRI